MKTFITGVCGSGKTFLAKKYAELYRVPFISFDEHFDYQETEDQFDWIMSILPESFVIDAIPLDKSHTWVKFLEYQKANDCKIVCCYTPNLQIWIDRIKQKQTKSVAEMLSRRIRVFIKIWRYDPHRAFYFTIRSFQRFAKSKPFKCRLNEYRKNHTQIRSANVLDTYYSQFYNFHIYNFQQLLKMQNVTWYDSIANEYTTFEEAIKRINLQ